MLKYIDMPPIDANGTTVWLPTLQKLYVIDEYIREHFKLPAGCDRGLGTVGLMLQKPIDNGGYWNSPENALTFAHTGGEGDHYSLLVHNGIVDEQSPVVMTWPTAAEGEVQTVVGESLIDFLCFGLHTGFFCVYGDVRWSSEESRAKPWAFRDLEPAKQDVLALLMRELNLTPWLIKDYPSRLQALKDKYLHQVVWSEE